MRGSQISSGGILKNPRFDENWTFRVQGISKTKKTEQKTTSTWQGSVKCLATLTCYSEIPQ